MSDRPICNTCISESFVALFKHFEQRMIGICRFVELGLINHVLFIVIDSYLQKDTS
jgi:hypothetical protein